MNTLKSLYHSNKLFKLLIEPIAGSRRAYIEWQRKSGNIVCNRLSELSRIDLEIEVSEFEGTFRIGPKSHLLHRILKHGSYEPEFALWTKQNLDQNKDAIDVGANIGFFSVLMAKSLKNRKVLAIEPTKSALARLKHNLNLNNVSGNIIVFNGLAGDSDSAARINIIEGLEEYSSAGKISHCSIPNFAEKEEYIQQKSIDSLVRENNLEVGLMKVDVEGFEHKVLNGAKNVLINHRPKILCELNNPLLVENGSSSARVVAHLNEIGYEVRDALYPNIVPGEREYGDIIAIPR